MPQNARFAAWRAWDALKARIKNIRPIRPRLTRQRCRRNKFTQFLYRIPQWPNPRPKRNQPHTAATCSNLPRGAREIAPRRKANSAGAAENPRARAESGYTAKHIEVLEGLEPVRRRPGMYIGGTDEKALHHLFAEVIDNSMDEALAGHATFIEVELEADGFVTVTDNGRGMPVDPHPKFKNKSALEVIMCTLHAGGKFDSEVYETSGGLHGVGVSVANALSERMEVEVAREQTALPAWRSSAASRRASCEKLGKAPNRRGTKVRFHPDPEIFGAKARVPARARVQDDALEGLSVRRRRNPLVLRQGTARRHDDVPEKATFHFADGLKDYLAETLKDATLVHPDIFTGTSGKTGKHGARAMGGGLDRRRRRLPQLLLQHHPDAGRRHPRSPACAPRCCAG